MSRTLASTADTAPETALIPGPTITKRGLPLHAIVSASTGAVPWLIIGGLLWAGLFIKPQPTGSTVQPPAMEQRDHYYGLAAQSGGAVWAAGSNGKILAIERDGLVVPFDVPTTHTLQDIASWDDSHAVAVGNDSVVLYTADGGHSWRTSALVPRSEVANKLNRVRVAADGVALATGEMGALLISRDYGVQWSRLRPEEDVAWNDVALLDNERLRAVGEFGRILVSDDGGSSWLDIPSPVQSSLMALVFKDAATGVAVGLEGTVLITRDGGQNWQRIELGSQDHLFDIAWDSAHERWIGTGSLGRWISAGADGRNWRTGRLDERDLSWHTRVVPTSDLVWFAGANVGRWDGERWMPLKGESRR